MSLCALRKRLIALNRALNKFAVIDQNKKKILDHDEKKIPFLVPTQNMCIAEQLFSFITISAEGIA